MVILAEHGPKSVPVRLHATPERFRALALGGFLEHVLVDDKHQRVTHEHGPTDAALLGLAVEGLP